MDIIRTRHQEQNDRKKCDANNAKGILGYRRGQKYAAGSKENKGEETRQEQRINRNTNRREVVTEARAKTRPQLAEIPYSEPPRSGK